MPDARVILVRNEKHGFRLTLPESDWVFRTDRWPLEVTDTEYFITVTPIRERRSEKQHLTRTLKRLRKRSNLMVGRARIETVEGRLVLQYYSQSVAGSSGSPTSLVDWNYRTCVDGSPAMVELHVVHHGTHEGPSAGSEPTIMRIVRSLEPDVEVGE
jgi:ribosomal protein L34